MNISNLFGSAPVSFDRKTFAIVTVEETTASFLKEADIARHGQPDEIAALMPSLFLRVPSGGHILRLAWMAVRSNRLKPPSSAYTAAGLSGENRTRIWIAKWDHRSQAAVKFKKFEKPEGFERVRSYSLMDKVIVDVPCDRERGAGETEFEPSCSPENLTVLQRKSEKERMQKKKVNSSVCKPCTQR